MYSGRVDNLRSVGSELMRPQSQDGTSSQMQMQAGKSDFEHQMRNSTSGFYKPPAKYGGTAAGDFRRPDEEERQ